MVNNSISAPITHTHHIETPRIFFPNDQSQPLSEIEWAIKAKVIHLMSVSIQLCLLQIENNFVLFTVIIWTSNKPFFSHQRG